MQVNEALHTCRSWYAYAAMFGSSTDENVRYQTLAYVQGWHLCSPNYPHSGRVLSAKTSSLNATIHGVTVHGRLGKLASLALLWPTYPSCPLYRGELGVRCVCVCLCVS